MRVTRLAMPRRCSESRGLARPCTPEDVSSADTTKASTSVLHATPGCVCVGCSIRLLPFAFTSAHATGKPCECIGCEFDSDLTSSSLAPSASGQRTASRVTAWPCLLMAAQPRSETHMHKNTPNGISNSSNTPHAASEPLLLRPPDAAKLLAISPRKLWELTNTREVPSVRIGRCLRYPKDELKLWVAEQQARRS